MRQFQPVLAGREQAARIDPRAILKIFQDRVAHFSSTFLFHLPPWDDATRQEADAALDGHFYAARRYRRCAAPGGWRASIGRWRGPNDDPEFAWFLNRQHHLPALFVAWRETKDARYRTALNTQLRDWLRQSPRPAYYSFSSAWRALEVARRMEEVLDAGAVCAGGRRGAG